MQDGPQSQFLNRVKLVRIQSFSSHIQVAKPRLNNLVSLYYFPKAGGRKMGMPFPWAWAQSKTRTSSSRILIRVSDSILYKDDRYAKPWSKGYSVRIKLNSNGLLAKLANLYTILGVQTSIKLKFWMKISQWKKRYKKLKEVYVQIGILIRSDVV